MVTKHPRGGGKSDMTSLLESLSGQLAATILPGGPSA